MGHCSPSTVVVNLSIDGSIDGRDNVVSLEENSEFRTILDPKY